MQVTETSDPPAAVTFGTAVVMKRKGASVKIKIVGEDEADLAQNMIAWTAPLSQALLRAEPGEVVDFEAGGNKEQEARQG